MAFAGHRPDYHGNWYHGDWHGHWGYPGGYRPWGWYGGGWGSGFGWGFGAGVATFGIASLASPWGWGYYSYYNPYWVTPVGGVTYINYSQPIVVAAPAATPANVTYAPTSQVSPQQNFTQTQPNGARDDALAIFENARSLFKRGEYPAALAQTNRAIALLPNDSVMHEFRALCLFATGDYQQSAAAVYAVLAAGPGWDWTTVSGLYPNPGVYADQLVALENYTSGHSQSASPHFLLAYHYLLAGHQDQAGTELQQVVRIEPRDQLSAQLLKGISAPASQRPLPEGPPQPAGPPVDAASIVGHWQASRPDGSRFELELSADRKFRWNFSQQDKQQKLTGTYTLAENFLILSADDQNSLVGQVSKQAGDKMMFKLAGGNPDDPGLEFARQAAAFAPPAPRAGGGTSTAETPRLDGPRF